MNWSNFFNLWRSKQPEEEIIEGQELTEAEEWAYSGTWLTLASSNVEEVKYLYDQQILEVQFKRRKGPGAYYQYYDVPLEAAALFLSTDSPGRTIWNHFRGVYDYALLSAIPGEHRPKPNVVRMRPDIPSGNLPPGEPPHYKR